MTIIGTELIVRERGKNKMKTARSPKETQKWGNQKTFFHHLKIYVNFIQLYLIMILKMFGCL